MFIGTRIVDDCDDQKKRKNVRIPHRPRAYPTNSQTQLSQQHSCLSSLIQPQHLSLDTWWSLASDVVGLFRVAPVGTKRSGTRSLEFLTSTVQSGRCLGKVTEDGNHGRFIAERLRQANICESLWLSWSRSLIHNHSTTQGIRRIGPAEHKRRNTLVTLCKLRLVIRLLYFCSLSPGGQFFRHPEGPCNK